MVELKQCYVVTTVFFYFLKNISYNQFHLVNYIMLRKRAWRIMVLSLLSTLQDFCERVIADVKKYTL